MLGSHHDDCYHHQGNQIEKIKNEIRLKVNHNI